MLFRSLKSQCREFEKNRSDSSQIPVAEWALSYWSYGSMGWGLYCPGSGLGIYRDYNSINHPQKGSDCDAKCVIYADGAVIYTNIQIFELNMYMGLG